MKYRREIDGWRAMAVVPVILFHAGLSAFRGGFVGVDVFFVISGFLITMIIVDEVEVGRFSVVRFYERRARRILPALFVVMLACIPFAWQLLSPHDLANFSQSLAAISLFASNVLFWGESGYFDTGAELKPLLHTWSLAVEEQFYVLYPLVLLALLRCGRKVVWPVIAAAAMASLWISATQVRTHPSSAFYLLPSRAWELLLGCLAAAVARRYGLPTTDRAARSWQQAASGLGLLLIAASVFLFDERTPFPGFNAIVPTAATVLVLLCASPSTVAGRLLGLPLFVGIGLISYTAYLWHQPIFALVRHACLGKPSNETMAAACALVPVLAILSWHFVEKPFRDRDRIDRRGVFAASLTGLVLFLVIGLCGYRWQETVTQWRLRGVPAEARRSLRTRPALLADRDGVVLPLLKSADRPFSADSPRQKVLILGDSMSEDLYAAVTVNAEMFPGIEFRRCLLDDTCMQDFAAVLTAGTSSPVQPASDCHPSNARLRDDPLFQQADTIVLCAQWLP
jgi:peptidoglycan/LPS O-acetylase OafA/YrhL